MKGPVIKPQALVSRDRLPPARSYPTPRGSITSKNIKAYPARDQVLKHVGLEVGVREETLAHPVSEAHPISETCDTRTTWNQLCRGCVSQTCTGNKK